MRAELFLFAQMVTNDGSRLLGLILNGVKTGQGGVSLKRSGLVVEGGFETVISES